MSAKHMEGTLHPCPHCAKAFHRWTDLKNHMSGKCKALLAGATPHFLQARSPTGKKNFNLPHPDFQSRIDMYTTGPRTTTRSLPMYQHDQFEQHPSMAAALGRTNTVSTPQTQHTQGPYGWTPPPGFYDFRQYPYHQYSQPTMLPPHFPQHQLEEYSEVTPNRRESLKPTQQRKKIAASPKKKGKTTSTQASDPNEEPNLPDITTCKRRMTLPAAIPSPKKIKVNIRPFSSHVDQKLYANNLMSTLPTPSNPTTSRLQKGIDKTPSITPQMRSSALANLQFKPAYKKPGLSKAFETYEKACSHEDPIITKVVNVNQEDTYKSIPPSPPSLSNESWTREELSPDNSDDEAARQIEELLEEEEEPNHAPLPTPSQEQLLDLTNIKPTSTPQKWEDLIFLLNKAMTTVNTLDKNVANHVDIQDGLTSLGGLIKICTNMQKKVPKKI